MTWIPAIREYKTLSSGCNYVFIHPHNKNCREPSKSQALFSSVPSCPRVIVLYILPLTPIISYSYLSMALSLRKSRLRSALSPWVMEFVDPELEHPQILVFVGGPETNPHLILRDACTSKSSHDSNSLFQMTITNREG